MRFEKMWLLLVLGGLCLNACSDDEALYPDNYGVSPEFSVVRAPLSSFCSISLKDNNENFKKTVDIETDYVPNVTHCENGGAPDEGLRSQAVAARSVAYYNLARNVTTVYDSTKTQVYSCESRAPNAAQMERLMAAAQDTGGMVLMRGNTIICAFYRSGSKQKYLNEDCVFAGDKDSEGYISAQGPVTYNWGKSGNDVIKSSSGSKSAAANSGCLSQEGQMCLTKKGWIWENVLRFFYGMDVSIVQAAGDCVKHPACGISLDGTSTIIDERTECFRRKYSDNYFTLGAVRTTGDVAGYNDSLQFAYTGTSETASGTWLFNVQKSGKYLVSAYIDQKAGNLSQKATYVVRAKGVETPIVIDQSKQSGWADLGKFEFAAGGDQWVKLTDNTGEAYTDASGKRVVFDALRFEYAENCSDACPAMGIKECAENGYHECGNTNGDACFEWLDVVACENGQVCSEGTCMTPTPTCNDACEDGKIECLDDNSGFRTCQRGQDGCLAWNVTNCGPAQVCQNEVCMDEAQPEGCSHECSEHQTKCDGSGYRTCGQFDDDNCRDWSEITACSDGQKCKNGQCTDDSASDDVMPSDCLTAIDGRPETIVDEMDACFVQNYSSMWKKLSDRGYDNHLYYFYFRNDAPDAVGTWYLNVQKAGKYAIYAYIEPGLGVVADEMTYEIAASGKTLHPTISLESPKWVLLGNYDLTTTDTQYVRLTDYSADEAMVGKRALLDAIKVVPYDVAQNGKDNGSSKSDIKVSSDPGCQMHSLNETHSMPWFILLTGLFGMILLRRRDA